MKLFKRMFKNPKKEQLEMFIMLGDYKEQVPVGFIKDNVLFGKLVIEISASTYCSAISIFLFSGQGIAEEWTVENPKSPEAMAIYQQPLHQRYVVIAENINLNTGRNVIPFKIDLPINFLPSIYVDPAYSNSGVTNLLHAVVAQNDSHDVFSTQVCLFRNVEILTIPNVVNGCADNSNFP
jgi:hypothetical protein